MSFRFDVASVRMQVPMRLSRGYGVEPFAYTAVRGEPLARLRGIEALGAEVLGAQGVGLVGAGRLDGAGGSRGGAAAGPPGRPRPRRGGEPGGGRDRGRELLFCLLLIVCVGLRAPCEGRQ